MKRQHTGGRGRSATVRPSANEGGVVAADSWDNVKAGQGCAFDAPRPDSTSHWELVGRLTASSWYLPHNQTYRGHGVLVFDPRHATRLDELSGSEWTAYAADLHRVATTIVEVCKPDHMNVESLGNVMPHLHWHVIPRYKSDGRWGQPIWAPDVAAQPERRLAAEDRATLLAALRAAR
jgi:diadenosine tetraphosphate (Ap4A) HIT family hydrolase